MDDATRAEVDAWLAKAKRDLDSAKRLLAGNPPYRDTAAYHCQQAFIARGIDSGEVARNSGTYISADAVLRKLVKRLGQACKGRLKQCTTQK